MAITGRVILFVAWGVEHVERVARCATQNELPPYPIVLITDSASAIGALPSHVEIIRRDFKLLGKERKAEALAGLPENFETVVFLDVDTSVIGDISLGFLKAEQFGIAMAPAPHYSLAHFRGFRKVMDREGVADLGQIIYNSGVIFFDWRRLDVRKVFSTALKIAERDETMPWGDQPYISLAMEMLGFNPYTLSPSFNCRAFGELVSGPIRIWHSYNAVPPDAAAPAPGFLYRAEGDRLVQALKVPL